ncbi:hypothetical protein BASA81_006560 [Batrachochytrium salamandrivorans]|nr:hypothetical protein BASA81_006560 [Batrachochytrium salamandrivorans]
MPVLLSTVLLGLASPSLHSLLEERGHQLCLAALLCVAANHWFFNRRPNATAATGVVVDQDGDLKKPMKPKRHEDGSLSESLSITAGAAFAYFAYQVLLSSEHRIHFAESRERHSYLERVAALAPFQMFCLAGMCACLVVLVGCAGMSYEESNVSRMSKAEAWCVVAFLGQAVLLAYLSSLHLYRAAFYANETAESNRGLIWGLTFAGIGQIGVLSFHYFRRELGWWRPNRRLQPRKPYDSSESFLSQTYRHVAKPSSLVMIGLYLVLTWVLKLMPASYYNETDSVDWFHVVMQLAVVDVFTYINHRAEHVLAPLYISSHKAHHRFTNPNVFDAFDGSVADTAVLILLPLFTTSQITAGVSTWSYIAFGFVYSTHFMLIHSEWACPQDGLASKFGIYVASDHHVHHSMFLYNYGHFFTFWDRYMGTYKELQ